jgi:hypothetical protein
VSRRCAIEIAVAKREYGPGYNVVPLCNAGERVSSLATSGVDYIAEIEKKKN